MVSASLWEKVHAISMFVIGALFLIYEMMLQVSPSIMMNDLMGSYKIDAATLSCVISAYFYAYAIMQVPAGLLFDYFGPRILICSSILFCIIGELLFSSTHSFYVAFLGRLLLGFGSAFAFVGLLVISAHWFRPKYFAILTGMTQFCGIFGAMVGVAPLAKLLEYFVWRKVLYGASLIGIPLAILAALILRNRPKKYHAAIMAPEKKFWLHLQQVISHRQVWFIGLYAFTSWGAAILFAAVWGVSYLSERFSISIIQASVAPVLVFFGAGSLGPIIGYCSNYFGRRLPFLWIGSIMGFFASLFLLFLHWLSLNVVFGLLLLMGVGTGMHALTFVLVRENIKPSIVATALGFNNMGVVLGGAVLPPIMGFILRINWDGLIKNGVPVYSSYVYERAFLLIPILYFIGFILSFFFIRETYCESARK